MNQIRRSAWMALMLGATAGCLGVEEPVSKPLEASSPAAPPKGGEPPKTTPSKEMTPPPAKDDAKANKPEDAKKPADSPKLEGPSQGSNSESAPAKLTDKELAAIKELPAAEQAVAIKQAVCPVSSKHLGSMEKPVKVSAEGRTFYICCEGCEEEVKTNPKGVLAKLDKK